MAGAISALRRPLPEPRRSKRKEPICWTSGASRRALAPSQFHWTLSWPVSCQGCEHRQDTGQLNVQWNWLGARARRLAPEVQQIGSFRFDLLGSGNGRLNAEIAPAIGERVRGDVQHPHDQYPVLQREGIPPRLPAHWRRGEVHRQQAYGL